MVVAPKGDGESAADLVQCLVVHRAEMLVRRRWPMVWMPSQLMTESMSIPVSVLTGTSTANPRACVVTSTTVTLARTFDHRISSDDQHGARLAADVSEPDVAAPHALPQASASSQSASSVSGYAR